MSSEKNDTKMSYPNPITLQNDGRVEGISVSKSNTLVMAQSKLSTRERKVLAACLALINPLGEYPNGIAVSLTDDQLEGLTGIKKKNLYEFIGTAAKNFHSIPVETPGKKEGTVDYINIAHRSVYDPDERTFTIKFHSEMEPHLLELALYTKYELKQLVKLTGKYAMMLYEILCMSFNSSRGGVQVWRISLEDIYYPFCLVDVNGKALVDTYVNNWDNFKKRILEPSVKQICEKTDFDVQYSTYKKGRKIAGLTFQMRKKTGLALAVDARLGEGTIEQQLGSLGIKENTIKGWVTKFGRDRLDKNIAVYRDRFDLGQNIDNPAAYMNTLLTHNVAGLPDVANPFSAQYKNNQEMSKFIQKIVVPIWWRLDENLRNSLEETGLSNHVVTSREVDEFLSLAKSGSWEEAETLLPQDQIEFEWNSRANDNNNW